MKILFVFEFIKSEEAGIKRPKKPKSNPKQSDEMVEVNGKKKWPEVPTEYEMALKIKI